jgi:hypothetical protein
LFLGQRKPPTPPTDSLPGSEVFYDVREAQTEPRRWLQDFRSLVRPLQTLDSHKKESSVSKHDVRDACGGRRSSQRAGKPGSDEVCLSHPHTPSHTVPRHR